ncbi:peroxide stress protein YaaA [Coprobacter sp.]
MIILLSCAKTMSNMSEIKAPSPTLPQFKKEASDIILQLTRYSSDELKGMLHTTPRLAIENYNRYRLFHSDETPELQALLAYTGIVFKNIAPQDFTFKDFLYAQEHLRITSFCYGLLRPLDGIKPYRLEGDVTLPETGSDSMFEYWHSRLTQTFLSEIQKNGNLLFNLASGEMKQLFDWKNIESSVDVITPQFKVWKNGKLTTVVIYTKMARGAMTRFIIKNRIEKPDDLKSFSWEGFSFNEELSDNKNFIFTQE